MVDGLEWGVVIGWWKAERVSSRRAWRGLGALAQGRGGRPGWVAFLEGWVRGLVVGGGWRMMEDDGGGIGRDR